VSRWFEQARSNDFEGIEHSYHQTTEGAHGRIESDNIGAFLSVDGLETNNNGQGCGVWAWWCVNVGSGTKQQLKSAYISSLEDDALVLAHAVPSHWGIGIPYIGYLMSHLMKMPAAFVEDNALNFSVLRRLSLNL